MTGVLSFQLGIAKEMEADGGMAGLGRMEGRRGKGFIIAMFLGDRLTNAWGGRDILKGC